MPLTLAEQGNLMTEYFPVYTARGRVRTSQSILPEGGCSTGTLEKNFQMITEHSEEMITYVFVVGGLWRKSSEWCRAGLDNCIAREIQYNLNKRGGGRDGGGGGTEVNRST